MSKTTIAEPLGLERFVLGWFVQFALRWPLRPQRKQIGDELLDAPAGRSGLDHWALGAEVALPIDLARVFGRGPCLPRLPPPFLPFEHLPPPFLLPWRPNRGCDPPPTGTTTG